MKKNQIVLFTLTISLILTLVTIGCGGGGTGTTLPEPTLTPNVVNPTATSTSSPVNIKLNVKNMFTGNPIADAKVYVDGGIHDTTDPNGEATDIVAYPNSKIKVSGKLIEREFYLTPGKTDYALEVLPDDYDNLDFLRAMTGKNIIRWERGTKKVILYTTGLDGVKVLDADKKIIADTISEINQQTSDYHLDLIIIDKNPRDDPNFVIYAQNYDYIGTYKENDSICIVFNNYAGENAGGATINYVNNMIAYKSGTTFVPNMNNSNRLVWHEVWGHGLNNFQHPHENISSVANNRQSVMNYYSAGVELFSYTPTKYDKQAAQFVWSRPAGNTGPDTDPTGSEFVKNNKEVIIFH